MKNELQHIAKILRKRPTDAEIILWRHLRGKRLEGFKFRRQEPIGNYVADFVCYEKRIIVEVDGSLHCREKDSERDTWFEERGFKVLRFWNNEVLENIQGVWEVIRKHCLSHPPLTPPIVRLSSRRSQGRGRLIDIPTEKPEELKLSMVIHP